jgi:hypothetical protein
MYQPAHRKFKVEGLSTDSPPERALAEEMRRTHSV